MKTLVTTVVVLALSSCAALARAADVIPYQYPGWRYVQVYAGDPLESEFMSASFDDSAWMTGQAGFGSRGYGCPLEPTIRTAWDAGSHLLLRAAFPALRAAPVEVLFAIDNDAVVWVNGVEVARVIHEGCPSLDEQRVVVPESVVNDGWNLLAVLAVDRGVVSYFDGRVSTDVATPVRARSWGAIKTIYR